MAPIPLKVIALNCTLKSARDRDKSSTQVLLEQVLDEFKFHDVTGEIVRVVDLNIKPGVESDEGRGHDWPKLKRRILATHILVVGTPIWLGQPSSVAKRICERMDAFISEKDEHERMPSYGKVVAVAVVGNEDGAHHVAGELHAALNEVGWTVPPNAVTYWVGEALHEKDYKDLVRTPKEVRGMTAMLCANAAHLARALIRDPLPGLK
jgi:multimeric flavodoxin WrbA